MKKEQLHKKIKKEQEDLGYDILKEFKEMQGRFNEKPWLIFATLIGCGAFWYIHITMLLERSEKELLLLILVGMGMLAEGIGALASLWYMIRKEKAGISFAVAIWLMVLSGRLCTICFPIFYYKISAYSGMQSIISFWCIILCLLFGTCDTIRFYHRYRRGCYSEGAKRDFFSFGIYKKVATGVVVISIFPTTLHNNSTPQEVVNLYAAYLMSLAFCMFNRFGVKAFMNVVLVRRGQP